MATATRESRAAGQFAPRTLDVRVPESMQFVMFEDNGGAYHWMLVAGNGVALAQAGGLASYDDAAHAARCVRDGAASARLDRRDGDVGPVDLDDCRGEWSDGVDAEHWLDKGGNFNSDTVTR